MKYLFIFFISILNLKSEDLKKRDFPYYSIIGGSDLIVQGKIKEKTEQNNFLGYTFIIDEKLKSNTSKQIITVKTFAGWTCDPRNFSKMKIGQELLLFLTENGNGNYEVINGGKGEIFTSQKQIRGDNGYYDFKTFKYGVKKISKHFMYKGPLNPRKEDNITFTRIKGTKQDSKNETNLFYKDFLRYIRNHIVE